MTDKIDIKQDEDTALIVKATALFDKDPEELAENEKDITTLVKYLRLTRENVRAAEAAGKRITKKAATTKTKTKSEENPLDKLAT